MKKILAKIKKNKKKLILMAVISVLLVMLLPNIAFAQDGTNKELSKLYGEIITFMI